MNKKYLGIIIFPLVLLLAGCAPVGSKTTNMSIIYVVTSFLSLLMLIGYFALIKKKEPWFFVLLISVLVVNIGYYILSVSKTLETALWANRIAYLGSVFLPLSMIMIIMKFSRLNYKKWTPYLLGSISIIVFFIAASPGYLDIYYKSVTLENVGGVSVLNKEYGPWHSLYLFYLLSYFIIMISIIVHAISKKNLNLLHTL